MLNRRSDENNLVWVGTKDGNFSIKRLYNDLEPQRLMEFPYKALWKSLVPSKVWFFYWEAT